MDFVNVGKKRQKFWKENQIYRVNETPDKESFYILDMFPYPSGAGLHVGHPKGYIATDVIARKHILQGQNVLHPMGFDTFGLPTEQFAIANKIKPQIAAEQNIETYKKQLEMFGCTYDWDRAVNTADPEFFKWTQWTVLQLYHHYYDQKIGKAMPISDLEQKIKSGEVTIPDDLSQSEFLDNHRLIYLDYKPINRCPSCKTGLANEDLEDGNCERCGSAVEQKPMRQWVVRITEYAERLLSGLDHLPNWTESAIEQQKNWIGKSEGSQFQMKVKGFEEKFEVYTTRLDTVFGMTFVVMAPEHSLVDQITTDEYKIAVEKYKEQAKHKTQLERTELQKEKTGQFTGAYAINPFNNQEVPIYIGDYVLVNYGTGVVMAVPAHDERDFEFAKKYNIPIKYVIGESLGTKHPEAQAKLSGYGFILDRDNQLLMNKISDKEDKKYRMIGGGIDEGEDVLTGTIREIKEETGFYDLAFQGEFFCCQSFYFADGKSIWRENNEKFFLFRLNSEQTEEKNPTLYEKDFSIERKTIDERITKFSSTPDVSAALIQLKKYLDGNGATIEKGILIDSGVFSGLSSDDAITKMQERLQENGIGGKKTNYKIQDWVFSRQRYWGEPFPFVFCEQCGTVPLNESDLPLELPDVEHYEPTGTEEGPLADIDFWTNTNCPKCGGKAKRESNTMPGWAGSSWYWIRYMDPHNPKELVSPEKEKFWHPVDIYVGGAEHITRHMIYARFWHKFLQDLGVVSVAEPFKKYQHVGLIMAEDGRKMSKRRGNVVNPDDIINEFGPDVLRIYEMFMGPFDQAVNWNTSGVKGVKKFLDRLVALSVKVDKDKEEDKKILNTLHKTIKKVGEDIDVFAFNTAISQLMILVNELSEQEQISYNTYKSLIVLLSPFAPHIAEELWQSFGNSASLFTQDLWPTFDPHYLALDTITLAVQINGKLRGTIDISPKAKQDEVMSEISKNEKIQNYLGGDIIKIIYIPGKICNIVLKN